MLKHQLQEGVEKFAQVPSRLQSEGFYEVFTVDGQLTRLQGMPGLQLLVTALDELGIKPCWPAPGFRQDIVLGE